MSSLLLDLYTDFSGGSSGGVVFPTLSEFSTVFCDSHKAFGIVNKAEIDIFLELSCFFCDPMDDPMDLVFDHFQLALIHGPNIPGSYATLLSTASDFIPSPVTSTTGCCFCLGSVSSVFLELVLH